MVQTIFNRDPNLRPSIQNIKQSYFFQDVDWSYLENSFSNEIVDIRAILNAIATRKQLKINQLSSVSSAGADNLQFNDLHLEDAEEPNTGSPKKGHTLFNGKVSQLSMTQVQSRKIHEALAHF